MSADLRAIRTLLASRDLRTLFLEELGWDRPNRAPSLEIEVDGGKIVFSTLAQKRNLVACVTENQGIPDRVARQRIERSVARVHFEHLLIYIDQLSGDQLWSWARRDPGKPVRLREEWCRHDEGGERLAERLAALVVTLEEEATMSLPLIAQRVKGAFDTEAVTRGFYERFQIEHDVFLEFIEGIPSEEEAAWYASLMINRLMFTYFIQKRGFLDGDTDYLRTRLSRIQTDRGRDHFLSFYRRFLLRLFHEGFGGKRVVQDQELERLIGRVPYLNGGLFDIHLLERTHPEIDIPDEAFERLFDFFAEYSWHLDDRPSKTDHEINPDVLGYIFEKYINQKQMGAYYTKEDITEYIAASTIIPRLVQMVQELCAVAFNPNGTLWARLREHPDRYIDPAMLHGVDEAVPKRVATGVRNVGARQEWNQLAPPSHAHPEETWRECIERRVQAENLRNRLRSGDVSSIGGALALNLNVRQIAQDAVDGAEGPELVRAFWQALTSLTILDPACGSGAFLFAALKILQPLYEGCLERMSGFLADPGSATPAAFADFRAIQAEVLAHPNSTYFILKSIIVRNLFGVDIMQEAVEICKLRLFLKLVAQVGDVRQLEPLPDVDFNVRAGNSLIGYASRSSLSSSPAGAELDLSGARGRLAGQAARLDELVSEFRREQLENSLNGEPLRSLKSAVVEQLDDLSYELDRCLAAQYGIADDSSRGFMAWLDTHAPFHWVVDFHEIMAAGGFDIVLGNPPYIEYPKVTGTYRLMEGEYKTQRTNNLYAYFIERSAELLRPEGEFGMIVPTSAVGLAEAAPLRELLSTRYGRLLISTYAIRPSKLFNGVDQRLCIILGSHDPGGSDHRIFTTRYHHWYGDERPTLFGRLHYVPSSPHVRVGRIPQVGNVSAREVLDVLERHADQSVGVFLSRSATGHTMHYHRSPRYWIRGQDFEPYFSSATKQRSVHHFRDLHLTTARSAKVVGALLNSSLFFFWFIALGNGRNLTGEDVATFPLGDPTNGKLDRIPTLFRALMNDYRRNSFIRVRQDCEFQEFRPSLSKEIIDEIDYVFADHFGLSPEQTDFIINFEVKYRLGGAAEEASAIGVEEPLQLGA